MVEDVVTTGGCTRDVVEVLRAAGARPLGAGSIVDRSGGRADVGEPRVALVTLQVVTYDPAECPLCAQGVPVVWVQHSDDEEMPQGSKEWELVPELAPLDSEPLVQKRYGDSFEATDLESLLAESDACIRSTLHGAFTRGYDVTLVGDAHTTGDKTEWGAPPPEQVITHTNLYWQYHSAPGRTAGTVSTAEVTFAPADAH